MPDHKTKKRLGTILLERGDITEAQLEEALRIQAEKGDRLGWILLTTGVMSRLQLFRAMAEHWDLPFEAFEQPSPEKPVDRLLLDAVSPEELTDYQAFPVSLAKGTLTLYTSFPQSRRTLGFFSKRFRAAAVEEIIITDLDLNRLIAHHYQSSIVDGSVFGLFDKDPEESAYRVFSPPQAILLGACLLSVILWLYLDAQSLIITLLSVLQVLYAMVILFRLVLSVAGARGEIVETVDNEAVGDLKDAELPFYTVLVPVYNEPEVLPTLIGSLKKIDYPQSKLDILLLLEENDTVTIDAAKAANPPGNWRFIIIPDGQPKTKPKACNYGVYFARGKYLTIYDAEDIPDPDQLKKAVVAFQKGGSEYICFQAALNYFNSDENLITRLFTLEYSYWFDYLLPGLDRMGLPIPLGGTSNHFDIGHLRSLGAWDPFNTTEDADLGIRAAANGLRVGVINSTTMEEANSRYGNWIRQRSRWIKGYMQTALVFNRHPVRLLRALGLKNWLSFQLFVSGTPFLFLVNPIIWSIFLFWLASQTKMFDPLFPPMLLYMGIGNLLFGNFLGVYLNMLAVFRRGRFELLFYALLNPFYWLFCHTPAAYKALWQLFTKPFYWEKTQHGISSYKPPVDD